jgi:hypothetical protein
MANRHLKSQTADCVSPSNDGWFHLQAAYVYRVKSFGNFNVILG